MLMPPTSSLYMHISPESAARSEEAAGSSSREEQREQKGSNPSKMELNENLRKQEVLKYEKKIII